MRKHCIIFVALLAVLSVSGESAESKEIDALILEQSKICQKETNATDKEVEEILDGADATTKTTKCFQACLMKKLGVMSAANKLEPDNLGKLIDDGTVKSKDGKTIQSVMMSVSDACKAVTDTDQCEAGVKIIGCLNAEAKKLGFEKNPF